MSTNRRLRESPPSTRSRSDEAASYKTHREEHGGKATELKTAERDPRQEIARRPRSRDSPYSTTSHKSLPRSQSVALPDSQRRMDSREETYSVLEAWEGQDHE